MKVIVEFDTETKKMSVSQDGALASDVDSISFYKNYYSEGYNKDSYYYMEMRQCESDVDNGTRKIISTMAKVLFGENEN